MAPLYKLYYFDGMGYAEPARLILSAAKVEFEDVRIQKEDWPKIKPTIPWGKVPALQLSDGRFICQSTAIIRYLAKTYGLVGGSDLEAAKCDEYFGVVGDLHQEVIKYMHATTEEAKAQAKQKIKEELLPAFCKSFDKILKENGTGYLIGSKLTYADIVVAYVIGKFRQQIDQNVTDNHPEIAKLEQFINNHPGIKEWIAKRPKTEW